MSKSLKKVLFISSSISKIDKSIDTYDYFAAIVSEVTIELQTKYPEVEVVLKVPGVTSNPHIDQVNFIEHGFKNHYDCIIVSPFNRSELYKKFADWKDKLKENRLLLIDQGFTDYREDKDNFDFKEFDRPPYVQANWIQGGEIAGTILSSYFKENSISCPHVVLLEGNVGSEERLNGFINTISNATPKYYPTYYRLSCDYSREKAISSFSNYIDNCIKSKKCIDAVFAANDEMAMGVREALINYDEQYKKEIAPFHNGRLPRIVGFDGIRDTTLLIQYGDAFLYDTVYVNLKEQIKKLLQIIDKLIVEQTKITLQNSSEFYVKVDCMSFKSLIEKKKSK
jgi:hypothetical protein